MDVEDEREFFEQVKSDIDTTSRKDLEESKRIFRKLIVMIDSELNKANRNAD